MTPFSFFSANDPLWQDADNELGNLSHITDGNRETRYVYDLSNQLIKVEKEGQSTACRYDPLGRRTVSS